jgi:photosystem II stability/assembly factor-like uncharacterized protein
MRNKAIYLAITLLLTCQFASAQWIQTDDITSTSVTSLAVSDTLLFAGTNDGRMFRSSDNGNSWNRVSSGLPNSFIHCLVLSGANLFVGGNDGVFLSTNNGTNWTKVSTGLPLGVKAAAISAEGKVLFAGTPSASNTNGIDGVYRSTDNGGSWARTSSGLTNTHIHCFASIGTSLFVGTGGGGVFRSTNDGESWTAVNAGLVDSFGIGVVASLVVSGSNLYAGRFGGVFLSSDNGETWSAANSGLPTEYQPDYAHCLAISGANLFAAISGSQGVFLSSNGGSTWIEANLGLTNLAVVCLAVCGSNMFAGTYNGGVWRRPLAEMVTAVEPIAGQPPHEFVLDQNYPNPFNPSTTIKYELPKSSEVRLSVYDLLGREVSVLVNEKREAGVHEVKCDGANLASGVYFYRLQAGDFVQSKKLIIVK